MPIPIIQRQRALSRVGEIRIGGEKPARGAGKKLDTFRMTSQHRDIIDRCCTLYGGAVTAWESPAGPSWQVYTETSSLPVLLIVGYSLRLNYEFWEGKTQPTRSCDGEEEQFSGGPCMCNASGKDECDIITRLMVVLPETDTSLGWQLRSQGENASRELSGAMMMAEEMARGRAFVGATLRLTQRRGSKDGKVVRYAVPVLDFNLADFAGQITQTAEARPALPQGFTPVAQIGGVTLDEGLAAVGREAEPRTRNGRQAAPIGPADTDILSGSAPIPVGDEQPELEPSEFINDAQRTLLWATAADNDVRESALREIVRQVTGQDSTKLIPWRVFDQVLNAVRPYDLVEEADALTRLAVSYGLNREKIDKHRAANPLETHISTLKAQIEKAQATAEKATA